MRVEPGAQGRASDRQLRQVRADIFHARDAVADDRRITGKLLPQRNRHCVLQVRPAGFDYVRKFLGLCLEGSSQLAERRQQLFLDSVQRREVDRCREHIVRALSHVHVIVRMDQRLVPSSAPQNLDRARGNHLVRVHVRRGSRPGLEHIDDEFPIELPIGNLERRLFDRSRPALVQKLEPRVRPRRCNFDPA